MTQLIPDLAGLAESGPVERPTSPVAGASDKNHGPRVENAPAALHDGPAAHVGLADVPLSFVGEKLCAACGQVKSLSEFNRDKYRRDGLDWRCRDCAKARLKKARQEYPERAAEYDRQWYETHADEKRAYQKARRALNPEKVRESMAKWRALHIAHERNYRFARYWANPEKFRARVKASREKHHDKVIERVYLWKKQNPDKAKAIQHAASVRRKARAKNAAGSFSFREWESLKARYGRTCLCCGRQEPEVKLTPDHVIPLARGGSNGIENIQPLCLSCNASKQAKTIDYRPEARAESEAQ